jgi:hypothetical protein
LYEAYAAFKKDAICYAQQELEAKPWRSEDWAAGRFSLPLSQQDAVASMQW